MVVQPQLYRYVRESPSTEQRLFVPLQGLDGHLY
jgi:hypothetical protein